LGRKIVFDTNTGAISSLILAGRTNWQKSRRFHVIASNILKILASSAKSVVPML